MAQIPTNDYGSRVDSTDPSMPQGKAKNIVGTTQGTGTPLEANWVNDDWGFKQAILKEAGITPSGIPDNAADSQYLEGLKDIISINNLSLPYVFETIEDMESISNLLPTGKVINITELGVSFKVISGVGTVNGINIRASDTLDQSYELIILSEMHINAFGAKCDGSAETTGLLQTALSLTNIRMDDTCVYEAREESIQVSSAARSLKLNGGTLIINQIYADTLAPNLQIDLGGGKLSQGMRIATVAVETVAGSNTIVVDDASDLVVGGKLSSSWGVGGEFPLNGVTGITILEINGNTVTLSEDMTGVTATLPVGLVIGDFDNSAFLSSDRGGFIVKNGEVTLTKGYYYNTTGVANLGGYIDFQDVNFTGNGRDQFYMRRSQKLRFTRCRSQVPYDVAKTGVFLDDNSSLYIADCPDMGLGNYDSNVAILGTHSTSEVVVSGATNIHGKTYLDKALGGFAADCLNGMFVEWVGSVNKISIGSGVTWRFITRHLITTTPAFQTRNQNITTLKIAADNIECALYNFNHDGAGNGITIQSFVISGVNILKSLNYVMGGVSTTNGASSYVEPIITGSTIEMHANGDQSTQTIQTGSILSSVIKGGDPINVSKNKPYLNDVTLVNQAIQINPTFSSEFVGGGGLLYIDNDDWPLSPANIFLIPGAEAGFANFYKAKSVDGDVIYDVYNFEGSVALSATVYIGNGKWQLQGDDWYIPQGSRIQDLAAGTQQIVSGFALATTTTASYTGGETTVSVANVGPNPAFRAKVGDKVNIVLDNGLVHTTTISAGYSESTLDIPVDNALPSASTSGANVMLFRVT